MILKKLNLFSDIRDICGGVELNSSLEIERLGNIISKKVLGGAKLGGLEKHIYDETPTIHLGDFLGMRIILSGFPGLKGEQHKIPIHKGEEPYYMGSGYYLRFQSEFSVHSEGNSRIIINQYLQELCKEKLECDEIKILPLAQRNK